MITLKEYDKFEHELNPEVITNVLKQRDIVNYDFLQAGKQLNVII